MRIAVVTTAVAAQLFASSAIAKPWKEPPTGTQAIPYSRVSEAFAAISKLEGAVVSGSEERGFRIEEANKRTQWSFTSPKDPAHPAVVRRTVPLSADERTEVAILCENKSTECETFLARHKAIGAPLLIIKPKASAAE